MQVLELHDLELKAYDGDAVTVRSPGYAVASVGGLVFGEAARGGSRVTPRAVENRFWGFLGVDPVANRHFDQVRQIDLASAHLNAVWDELKASSGGPPVSLGVAVPGHYTTEQLGLVLGVARSIGMPVVGLVDAGLAAARHVGASSDCLVLDFELHRMTLTRIHARDKLQRAQVHTLDQCGWLRLLDRWMHHIARVFVTQTRFDPLHHGASEQRLFDSLGGWLQRAKAQSVLTVGLDGAGRQHHQIDISHHELADAVRGIYDEIAHWVASHWQGEDLLLVGSRLHQLPGLVERLSAGWSHHHAPAARHGCPRIEPAPIDAVLHGTWACKDVMAAGDGPQLVTGLAMAELLQECAGGPTHVVLDGVAHRVTGPKYVVASQVPPGAQGLSLGAGAGLDGIQCSLYWRDGVLHLMAQPGQRVYVGGQRVTGGRVLDAGDQVSFGEGSPSLLLVSVPVEQGRSGGG